MRAVETSLIQRAADALWNADRAGTAIAPVRELLGAATDIGLRYAVEVSSGSGAACLGNPIHAARWLADTLCERGIPLRAGDVVMMGALGPMKPIVAGDESWRSSAISAACRRASSPNDLQRRSGRRTVAVVLPGTESKAISPP